MLSVKTKTAETYICLDVGSGSLKVAEVVLEKGRPAILGWAVKDVEQAPGSSGEMSYAIQADTIKQLLKEHGFTSRRLLVAVRGKSVIVRTLRLPKIPDRELAETVAFELKKDLPFPIEETYLQFVKLEESSDEKIEVLVAVVRREVLSDIITLSDSLDMSLAGVFPSCLCLNALVFKQVADEPTIRVSGIIDIGHTLSGISFLKDGKLRFTKDITYASNHMTRSVARAVTEQQDPTDEDLAWAEKEKKRVGIISDSELRRLRLLEADTRDVAVCRAVKKAVGSLIQKLRLAHGIFKSQTKEIVLDRIYLFGGGACLKNAAGEFQKQFDTNVIGLDIGRVTDVLITDEFQRIGFEKNQARFAAVAGLAAAIGSKDRFFNVFNLVPEELRPSMKRDIMRSVDKLLERRSTYVAAAALFLTLAVLQFAVAGRRNTGLKAALKKAEETNRSLSVEVEEFETMKKNNQDLEDKIGFLEKIESDYINWSSALRDLARSAPEGMIVEDFNLLENKRFNLNGQAQSMEMCSPFRDDLSAAVFFKDVQEKRCFKDMVRNVYRFTFEGVLVTGPGTGGDGGSGGDATSEGTD